MPKVAVLYHYFYPDDVVSARHYEGFCEELVARGWEVDVFPCNRGCRDETKKYAGAEVWRDIRIRRIWRPAFKQGSTAGRLLNTAWMLGAWSLRALRDRKPDVLVIGSDPPLSVLVARVWKRLRPQTRIAHWCFDVYPEAAIAEEVLREQSWSVRLVRQMLRPAYHSCDLIADLGHCMREVLEAYSPSSPKVTLTPWALHEPPEVAEADVEMRKKLFGEARLGILYSGNFGRAHSCEEFFRLARLLRDEEIHFTFSVRGNAVEALHRAVRPDDTNISFCGFASEADLPKQLAAADIHLASLKEDWAGLVVPSKFFGSLAAGRPVIFSGPRDASIARWIEEHGIGWVLDAQSLPGVAQTLKELAKTRESLEETQRHCHAVYQSHFSREAVMNRWDQALRSLLDK